MLAGSIDVHGDRMGWFAHARESMPLTDVNQPGRLITSVTTIAERLREARLELKLSQKQLARLAGALGGGRQTTIDSANVGAMSGMGRAAGDALSSQKRMVINCMVGRGYRALEVTPALGSYQSPQQLHNAAAQPMPTPQAATRAPIAPIGQFAYEAERIPESRACAAMPQASLVSKGPGFELYAVACRNSDTLMVRCEMGNCRVMR